MLKRVRLSVFRRVSHSSSIQWNHYIWLSCTKNPTAWVYRDTCPSSAKLFQCPINNNLNNGCLNARTGRRVIALEQTEDGHTDGTESSASNERLRGRCSGVAGGRAGSRVRGGSGSRAEGRGDSGVGGGEGSGSAGVDLRQRCLFRARGSRNGLAQGTDLV